MSKFNLDIQIHNKQREYYDCFTKKQTRNVARSVLLILLGVKDKKLIL